MAEIDYKNLKTPLAENVVEAPSPVYLIFGEEMLAKEAYRSVVETLLPEKDRSLNYEVFDGSQADLFEIVERVNTYSMMPGKKVVALTEARLFLSGQDRAGLIEKTADAFAAGDRKTASRHFLSALSVAGLRFDDLSGPNREKGFQHLGAGGSEPDWLEPVLAYCREKNLKIPADKGGESALQAAVEKGFPEGNHLLITTEQVDRRRSLYAAFKQHGTVIDCSVPRGERKADRQVQQAVMRRLAAQILEKAGKRITREAEGRLHETIGFDLRGLSAGLAKLIDYTGDRPQIDAGDVEKVLKRSKKDPIFEFTNALTDRDLDGSLFYLTSLLEGGVLSHPLQLLAAAVGQIRKLVLFKEFAESEEGRNWQPGMNFNLFKGRVLPLLQNADQRLVDRLERWQLQAAPLQTGPENGARARKRSGKAGRKAKGGGKTDLRMVPNPNNAYPVYLMLKKSDRFALRELTEGLALLARVDVGIKTGAGDPRLLLEQAVIAICSDKRGAV